MIWVGIFGGLLALAVVSLVIQARKAGPQQISELDLQRGRVLLSVTAEEPGEGWQELGSKTVSRGLDLRFDHDDDPQAEAALLVPEVDRGQGKGALANQMTIQLGGEFETHHIHTGGYVFRIRLKGTGRVIGKEVRMRMAVCSDGRPYGGGLENDDDTDAAVGDWIEVESAEIVELRSRDR